MYIKYFEIYYFILEEYKMMRTNILPCGNLLNMDEIWDDLKVNNG
jgi:hypothetical protein